jgi:hypothetical protein
MLPDMMLLYSKSLRQRRLKLFGKCGSPGNMHIEPCAFPAYIQESNGDWIFESRASRESLKQSTSISQKGQLAQPQHSMEAETEFCNVRESGYRTRLGFA